MAAQVDGAPPVMTPEAPVAADGQGGWGEPAAAPADNAQPATKSSHRRVVVVRRAQVEGAPPPMASETPVAADAQLNGGDAGAAPSAPPPEAPVAGDGSPNGAEPMATQVEGAPPVMTPEAPVAADGQGTWGEPPAASAPAQENGAQQAPTTPEVAGSQRHRVYVKPKSRREPAATEAAGASTDGTKPAATTTTVMTGNPPVRVESGPVAKLGLRQAVALALERHPSIYGARAMIAQTEAQVAVAKSARWPVISYGVGPGYDANAGQTGKYTNVQTSLGITETLYDFGATPGSISGAEARRDKQTYLAASATETVAQQTAETFVEMVAAQEVIAAADRQAQALDDIRVKIERRVKAGLSDVSDLKRTDVSVQRAVADRLQAQTRYNIAADTMAQLIGLRVGSVADMPATLGAVQQLGPRGDSVEDAPALQAARSGATAADADLKVARGRRYPSIGVGVTRSDSLINGSIYTTTQFGLMVHGNFETGRGAMFQVEAASAAREAAEHDVEYQRLSAETALATADQDAAGARSRIEAYDKMMQLWKESRELYWQEYVLNKRSLSDVFNMERDIFSADAERIDAIKQGMVATLRAHAATGSLVEHLRGSGRS